mgnify:CR=1 FL=1
MFAQRLFFTFIYSIFFILFLVSLFLLFVYWLGPPPIEDEVGITIVDSTGQIIDDSKPTIVPLDEMPDYLVDALILTEDQNFYQHFGFDIRGIARAVIRNIEAGQLREGASTITQQLARNLYLSHEKTWNRKIKESFYTVRLEMFYSKDTILTMYLNSIYFGHGAYGIGEASELFFDKKVHELSLAEATMLMGIPKGPTYYSPFNDLDNATSRQQFILDNLLRKQAITEADYYVAKSEELQFSERRQKGSSFAAHFIDFVWQEATEKLGLNEERLLNQNVTIHTTLDSDLQKRLEESLQHDVLTENEIEIGFVSVDPNSGGIRQMVGGKDYSLSPFNRATKAKRMVGSTFKPILYYAALENGFTATTMLQSEPTSFIMDDVVYEPSNYNGYYAYEPISLAQAMALSDNIYAVKTHLFLSPEIVVKTAENFGITADLPNVASLALGTASIPLIEMVQAYSIIANGGNEVEYYAIEKIETKNGRVLYEKESTTPKRIFDAKKTFLLTHLMTGMFDRRLNGYMEVTGSSIIDRLPLHEYAGKSGTTSADSWMIGFSPKLVAGVWLGYDDNRPLRKREEKILAKQIWADVMNYAHQEDQEKLSFIPPSGIVSKVIDVETGLLATEYCDTTRTTFFEIGTEPTAYCNIHGPEHVIEDEGFEEEKKPFYKQFFDFFPY